MSNSDQFSSLCTALGASQKSNGEWSCRCPAHEDSDPSLWLREVEDGKILLHCFAGCSQDQVIEALKAKGLWGDDKVAARRVTPDGVPFFWPPAAVLKKQGLVPSPDTQKQYVKHYVYRDLDGKIIGHVVRYEGHGKKDIIPFFKRWDNGNSWRSGYASKSARPIYGLWRLRDSTADSRIFIVEGEKCADAISSSDGAVIGLTWAGGAKSYSRSDFSSLSNLPVTLWPDADSPGVQAMERLSGILRGLGCAVSFVDLSQFGELPLGWDCADWLVSDDHKNLDALGLKCIDSISPTKIAKQCVPDNRQENSNQSMTPIRALNDVGNGQRFVALHGNNVKFALGAGWKVYNGRVWEEDHETIMLQLAARVAESISLEALQEQDEDRVKAILKFCNQSQNVPKLKSMLEMARSSPGVLVDADVFDPDNYLFCVQNGVVDLRTGKLRDAQKSDLITKYAKLDYDENAKAPLWNKFVHEIMGGDEELVQLLKRAIGYSLTGDTSEQVLFLLHGGGSNGKTVFIETLKKIFGTYSMATDAGILLLNSRGDAATGSNSIARLQGARFVVGSEISPGARFNEQRMKELTGQDTVSARYLFEEFFDFMPDFKFWLRCNDLPEIRGDDLGVWRRIIRIPFEVKFTAEQKDKNLPDKLAEELPGILNWAIEGCLDWQKVGLNPPEVVTDAVTNYKQDMDILGEWLGSRCAIEPGAMVSSRALYVCYTQWCKANGEQPASHRKIGIALRRRGFARLNYPDGRYYKDIKILEQVSEESGVFSEGFAGKDDDIGIL